MSASKFKLIHSSVGAALSLNLLFHCDDCKNRLLKPNGWFRFKDLCTVRRSDYGEFEDYSAVKTTII